jgi:hypothetical protein
MHPMGRLGGLAVHPTNLLQADERNAEDHSFLRSAATRYGLWFSKPGNGVPLPYRSNIPKLAEFAFQPGELRGVGAGVRGSGRPGQDRRR